MPSIFGKVPRSTRNCKVRCLLYFKKSSQNVGVKSLKERRTVFRIFRLCYSDILHIDKQNVDAIYVRAMCLYFQDDIDRAFAHFQQLLRLAPDHAKALEIYKVQNPLIKYEC